MTNRSGIISKRMDRIIKYLKKQADYRHNVVTGKTEYKSSRMKEYEEITDYELNSTCLSLAKENISCHPNRLKEILESKFTHRYNPFQEYLNNLPKWDGKTDFIKELSESVIVKDNIMWSEYFKKWFVAMVASLLNDDVINHTVLVFAGPQGVGKSTWLYNIIPDELKRYYYSGIIKLKEKDTMILLAQSMLINLEEIAYLGKNGLNELKEIITKQEVSLRKPYGRFVEKVPHRASFAGSLNEKEFLTDLTGSRRFLSFEVESIDYKREFDLRQVYAQAVALYKSGEFRFWFNQKEIAALNENNEGFRVKSLEEEYLLQTYQPCLKGHESELLSATDILNVLHKKYGLEKSDSSLQRLGKALKGNSFLFSKRKGSKVYHVQELSLLSKQVEISFDKN